MESSNSSNWFEDCSRFTEELSKIRDEMKSQSAENGQFWTEIGILKLENKLSMEKNNTLLANNREMQARLETMEQKLKVVELETKLAKIEMQNLFSEKNQGLLAKVDLLEAQYAELQSKQKEMESDKLVSEQQVAQMVEEKVNKIAGQLEEGQSKFMGESQQKFEDQLQFVKSEIILQNIGDKLKEKLNNVWSSNKWEWDSSSGVILSWNRLIATNTAEKNEWINVHAQKPVSRPFLESISGYAMPFVYYFEVQLKNARALLVGWVDPSFLLNYHHKFWIGDYPGSYAIDWGGCYLHSGYESANYAHGYGDNDVVGSGLLLAQDGRLKLFFTKNGYLNGSPVILSRDDSQNLLYPAISFYSKGITLEANFGADPAKPFHFDIDAHETLLFD